MPAPVDLATLLAQMPHVAKAKSAVNSQSESQQASLGSHVEGQTKRDREKVGKAARGKRGLQVDEDKPEGGGAAFTGHERDSEKRSVEDEPVADASPWCGKIINREI